MEWRGASRITTLLRVTTGVSGVLNYVLLTTLWTVILVLYVRARKAAKSDELIRMLLSVLILDAARTVLESTYFGLTWGANWGVLPEAFKALGNPLMLTLVKLPAVAIGVAVLVWVIRWWVPTELADRQTRREQELTLRTQLEASLEQVKESEERFRVAASASRDAVWDWDLQSDRIFTSPRFAEMLGYQLSEWTATVETFKRIVHPDDFPVVLKSIKDFRKGRIPAYDLRYRMLRQSGEIIHVHTSGTLLRDSSGVARRFVGFTRDITDEVAAELARVQTQKLESLGLLAGGIAHDFNNLLAVLSASLALAERQAQTGRSVQETLGTASLAVQRAAVLTRQLLAYAGRARLAQQPLDLNQLVRSMVDLFAISVSRKVRIDTHLAATLPSVLADDGQLQQVLMNLITNASEAIGDREGLITLETAQLTLTHQPPDVVGDAPLGPTVVIRVKDTGAGMTPEVKARIFDPFFSTKGSGRGLGLAALSGILRGHGGAFGLVTKPGEGTTFSIYLPALPAHIQPAPAAAAAANGTTPLTARVLVVDDEALLRRSAARLLKHMGCAVIEANDGKQALEHVRTEPGAFDLVLMDVTMPVMDGFEAARLMHELAPGLPIILSSGYAHDFEARLPEGVLTLPKPYDGEQLERTVRSALAKALAA